MFLCALAASPPGPPGASPSHMLVRNVVTGVRDLVPAFIDTPLLQGPIEGSNRTIRETVTEAGLELSNVTDVAEAAWQAVHGDAVQTDVGKTAFRMKFAARWMPGQLRKMMRRGVVSRE